MLKSMTGFARVDYQKDGVKVNIEIKCLNGKQLDINTRLPRNMQNFDLLVRDMIKSKFSRGTFSVNLNIENNQVDKILSFNTEKVKAIYESLNKIRTIYTALIVSSGRIRSTFPCFRSVYNFLSLLGGDCLHSPRISKIDGIIQTIPVKIGIPARKSYRILRSPSSGIGIVIPITESNQSGITVIQPSGKPERHGKIRSRIREHIPEGIVVNPLHRIPGSIRNNPERTDLIVGKEISRPAHRHGKRHSRIGIFESHLSQHKHHYTHNNRAIAEIALNRVSC